MPTTIFLSYARGDDEPFVHRLYADLTAIRGVEIWFDRERMPSRGLTFLQEIRDAIDQRERLVLVVGPKALTSDYVTAEWRHALTLGKAITPVLRHGDFADLPPDLRPLDARDFREEARYAIELAVLTRQVSDPVPPMGKLVGVPSLPPHFRARPEGFRALKNAVMADLVRPIVVTGAASRVGVHGMGGIGKSVLATAVARDSEVRRAFPDGVFWLAFGQRPGVAGLQRSLARHLGGESPFETVEESRVTLSRLLADKRALLILDDVWEADHAKAFDVLGQHCRGVFTTRDAALITALGGTEQQVQLLTDAEAVALLADWAETTVEALPPGAGDVAGACGRLPLALAICGAMVRDGRPWTDLRDALRDADLEFVQHPHGSIARSITLSYDTLTADEQQRFAELAVFPTDPAVPEAAALTLWGHTGNLSPRHARDLLVRLQRRALVRVETELPRPAEEPRRTFSLHALIHDFAASRAGNRGQLQERLLDAYRAACPTGWASGPDDGYFFQSLANHLIEAGKGHELIDTLLDLKWLEAKNERGLAFDLPRELADAQLVDPADHPQRHFLPLLDEALRRDIGFIDAHHQDYPQALFQSLWNHGFWYDCDDVARHYQPTAGVRPFWDHGDAKLSRLLERWRQSKETREPSFGWVRSLRPPKIHLGSPQRAVLSAHSGHVGALAYSPDEAWLVSGGWDGNLIVWDARRGRPLGQRHSPGYQIHAVAISPDGEVVAAPVGPVVQVWNLPDLEPRLSFPVRAESVAFLSDGRLACGDVDGKVLVWEMPTGTLAATLAAHQHVVQRIAVSPQCSLFATSSLHDVAVFDMATLTLVRRFEGRHEAGWIKCLAISRDGVVVSGDQGGQAHIWDGRSGGVLASFGTNHLYDGSFSADGRLIATASALAPNALFPDEPGVQVWDARTGARVKAFVGHDWEVHAVAFSPTGREIASGSRDTTVRLWDMTRDSATIALKGHALPINGISFSPDGALVTTSSHDGTVGLWDAATGRFLEAIPLHEPKTLVRACAFSADGQMLLSASWDETARVWDLRERRRVAVLPHHASGKAKSNRVGWVDAVAISRDGQSLATGCHDHLVRVWDGRTFTLRHRLAGHTAHVTCVAFSPDGSRLASAGFDDSVRLWDVASGRSVVELKCESMLGIDDLAFSDDGRLLAAASVFSQTVIVWDAASLAIVARLAGQADATAAVQGPKARPWRIGFRHNYATIRSADAGDVAGRLPIILWTVASSPNGRIWAGVDNLDKHLELFALEGGLRPAVTAS